MSLQRALTFPSRKRYLYAKTNRSSCLTGKRTVRRRLGCRSSGRWPDTGRECLLGHDQESILADALLGYFALIPVYNMIMWNSQTELLSIDAHTVPLHLNLRIFVNGLVRL